LHEHHRCRGRWRVASFAFTERPAIGLIVTCAALDAVLMTAVHRFAKL
jgi:hypothetical protein